MHMLKQKFSQGFTLIELLVVISVISILAAFVATAVYSGRVEARDMSRLTDLEQIKLGIKLYKEAYGEYPDYTEDYPDGIEIGVGLPIDADLEPFVGQIKADPLSTGVPGGDYAYWYASNYYCKGENHIAVMAKTVEKEKFDNYDDVCVSSELSIIKPLPWIVRITANEAKAQIFINLLQNIFNNNTNNNNNNNSDSCTASLPSSQLCSFDVSASRSSLPSGGGSVTICWAFDTAHSDPIRTVTGGGINFSNGNSSGIVRGERTVTIDRTTTFTATAQQDGNGGNPNIACPASSVTVVVDSPSTDEPIYGCTDPDARNYNQEANSDDDSCLYTEDELDEGPGANARFDRVLLVN